MLPKFLERWSINIGLTGLLLSGATTVLSQSYAASLPPKSSSNSLAPVFFEYSVYCAAGSLALLLGGIASQRRRISKLETDLFAEQFAKERVAEALQHESHFRQHLYQQVDDQQCKVQLQALPEQKLAHTQITYPLRIVK